MSNSKSNQNYRYKWSSSQTEEFVKLYIQHECLWNPEHPSYRKKSVRHEACNQIIKDFQCLTDISLSHNDLRLRFKTIRTMYLQQLKLILKRSTPDNIYKPSLPWFDHMDRNLGNITGFSLKKRLSNGSNSSEGSIVEHYEDDKTHNLVFNNYEANQEDIDEQDPFTEDNDEITVKNEKLSSTDSEEMLDTKGKVKRKNDRYAYSSQDDNSNRIEDEFDVYGRHIATQLRQMKLEKAIRLQLRIQSLISQARIEEICDLEQ